MKKIILAAVFSIFMIGCGEHEMPEVNKANCSKSKRSQEVTKQIKDGTPQQQGDFYWECQRLSVSSMKKKSEPMEFNPFSK
ncbi:hypothetical protein VST7929_01039 [Vibrio stylophorae]|uniref:Entry exclusion lipoprotein TrbK n=1 Tax=Vibrio stylophorae TaxID=659351 RepID=A0ABN8DRA1_9VIBR|nr:entry exclusion lipoprotein TrbK [Vibrio stylophorae]CAH0533177.1 hypothetical protein VST7929_01039 [Vibrio stylophorae]